MMYPSYIVFHTNDSIDDFLAHSRLDPYDDEQVKSDDHVLHRTLSEIFRERNYMSTDQMRELIRGPEEYTEENSIFKLILEREPALDRLLLERNKISLLWIAVLHRYQDSAELLVRSGADVNEPFAVNYPPVRKFLLYKNSSVLHALFKMYPSKWNERFIDLVIEHGADLTVRDGRMQTLLHLAAEFGRVRSAEMLLERGADVNAIDIAGMTPLLNAAISSYKKVHELIPLLVKHGADVSANDMFGGNALHFLASQTDRDYTDLARILIEKGLSPHETRFNQGMPIHAAVAVGMFKMVKLLLDHGANVNARGVNAEFPLFVAILFCKNPAMLLTLLERGADIDMKTSRGVTALYKLADVHGGEQDRKAAEKVKILLSVGADMFAKARNDGSTPFDAIKLKNTKNPLIRLALKTLALKKACLQQPPIELKGERTVKEHPLLWNFYQECIGEIDQIKAAALMKSGTLFELLTKCQCQVVPLMRYHEFESKFRKFDLSAFPLYAEDIQEAFERAQNFYHSVLEKEKLIDAAVINILPHMVVRSVAFKAVDCDICDIKKTVHASRGKSQ